MFLGDGAGHWTAVTSHLHPPIGEGETASLYTGVEDLDLGDVNGDGHLDIVAGGSDESGINVYLGDGTGANWTLKATPSLPKAEWAVRVRLADVNRDGTGVSMGAVWGDYDGDGFEDLFLYKYGRPELFRNDGGRAFVAVGERAGLPRWVNANAAIWLDYDRDGRLDLFLAGYWPETIDLRHLQTTRIMPESFEYAGNGGRKYLFRNRGDGTFEEVAEALGIRSRRWTLAARGSVRW